MTNFGFAFTANFQLSSEVSQSHSYGEIVGKVARQRALGICLNNKKCIKKGSMAIRSKGRLYENRYHTDRQDEFLCPLCGYALFWMKPWEKMKYGWRSELESQEAARKGEEKK